MYKRQVPNEGTLTMNYNASKETVIALNVRKFESEIGGRDLVADVYKTQEI